MSIPFDVNSLQIINSGSEGTVYSCSDTNFAIKIMQKDFTRNSFYKIKKNCKFLKDNKFEEIVSIINYGTYEKGNYLWIMMEKLKPLSKNESKEFNTLKNIYHFYFLQKLENDEETMDKKILQWELLLKNKKIRKFLRQIVKLPIYHADLFEDNILKDKNGNYKIIDVNDFIMV